MTAKTLLISGLLLAANSLPGFCSGKAGTAGAAFLKLPPDARTAAMGEASVGAACGAMAIFQNPAGLACTLAPAASLNHALMVEDLSYDVFGFAQPLRKAGVLGVGAQLLGYGGVDSIDKNEAAAGTLSPSDAAYAAGWGVFLDEDIAVGGAVKYVSSKISGSASAPAADLGLLISGEDLTWGAAVQNLGGGLKYREKAAPLPTNFKFGVSIPYKANWHWTADVNLPRDGAAWLAAGAEYAMDVRSGWAVYWRAGYNSSTLDTEGVNGLSAGFGLEHNRLSFDYAFKTMGLLGSYHYMGLSYKWPAFATRKAPPPAAKPAAVLPAPVRRASVPARRAPARR